MAWWVWMTPWLGVPRPRDRYPRRVRSRYSSVPARWLVGTLAWIDVVESTWLQVLLFSAFAVVTLVFFRGRLVAQLATNRKSTTVDDLRR